MNNPASRRPIVRLALSRAEVALSIGVSTASVDQMVAEGALPPARQWHSRKLWLVSEIEASLAEWPVAGAGAKLASAIPTEAAGSYGAVGIGGYPIPTSPDDEIARYYRQLGFDPRTMDQADMTRLLAEAKAKWAASLIGTALQKRERETLLRFRGHPVGVLIPWQSLSFGAATAERLEARGLIEISYEANDLSRIKGSVLTAAGHAAAESLQAD